MSVHYQIHRQLDELSRYEKIERALGHITNAIGRLQSAGHELQALKARNLSDSDISKYILKPLSGSRECVTTAMEIASILRSGE